MDSGFLPEDYLQRKAERRTNTIAMFLFVIVTFAVVGAFFVTNRSWNDVRAYQKSINVRYAQAAEQIEQLNQLEEQHALLMQKAEVTTALKEKVPRSRVLAELINRMPGDAKLMELELTSKRLDTVVKLKRRGKSASEDAGKSLTKKRRTKSRGGGDAEDGETVVKAPRYETSLEIIGVAPRHTAVARYLAGLQMCDLLENVELVSTERQRGKDADLFRFMIEADIRGNADARDVEPLLVPRHGSAAVSADELRNGAKPQQPTTNDAELPDQAAAGDWEVVR